MRQNQFPTPNSQFPINSQLPTPNSQLPTPNSQLPTPNSPHSQLKSPMGFRSLEVGSELGFSWELGVGAGSSFCVVDQRHRCRLAVRRGGNVLDPHQPWLQRDAGDHRLRCLAFPCMVAAPVPSTITMDDAAEVESALRRAAPERGPDPRRYSRASRIAVIAASEAWADAGLRLNEPGAGVLVGSGAGGIDIAERQYFEFFADGWKRVTPYAIPVSIVGMISSEISIALELTASATCCRPGAPVRPTRSAMPRRSSGGARRT